MNTDELILKLKTYKISKIDISVYLLDKKSINLIKDLTDKISFNDNKLIYNEKEYNIDLIILDFFFFKYIRIVDIKQNKSINISIDNALIGVYCSVIVNYEETKEIYQKYLLNEKIKRIKK